MQTMVSTMQRIARHEARQHWNAQLGLVKSVQGRNGDSDYACTVELRESKMVLPRVPIASSFMGSVTLPRENDLVVVLFLGGDLHAPVVVGRLYNEAVLPPVHGPGELVVSLPGGEEESDQRLELRVTTPGDGSRSLLLVLDGSVRVEMEVKDDGIRLQAQDAMVHLSQSGSNDGKVEVSVGESSIVLEQGGDVTVEAQSKLTLKAQQIEIAGDATVKIAGQTIDLN